MNRGKTKEEGRKVFQDVFCFFPMPMIVLQEMFYIKMLSFLLAFQYPLVFTYSILLCTLHFKNRYV